MLRGGVRFEPPLLPAILRRRYKRFLADVELEGQEMVVHCANPGRMTTCAPDGAAIWLHDSQNAARKLRYTWELVRVEGDLVCVNTARGNQLVAAALEQGTIPELAGYSTLAREVKVGASRIDFVLSNEGQKSGSRCVVEVKTVTLRSAARECAFPDSVTTRGKRHLEELVGVVSAGDRAVLLFVCAREGTDSIRPAGEIDPSYAETLAWAVGQGVEILAYRTLIDTESISLADRIPVVIGP